MRCGPLLLNRLDLAEQLEHALGEADRVELVQPRLVQISMVDLAKLSRTRAEIQLGS